MTYNYSIVIGYVKVKFILKWNNSNIKWDQQKIILQLFQRYELKFLIPESFIDPISQFVSVYCSLDKYSERPKNNLYRINNLYFDTPNYLFLMRRIDDTDKRFNMRIRVYNDTAAIPCFFEIKKRNVNFIEKYRTEIHDENWHKLFSNPEYELLQKNGYITNTGHELFLKLASTYNASPKVLSQYMRKAYISDVDDYGRVTFDRDLKYQPAEGYNLIPNKHKMISLDHEGIFDRDCNVILEMKCYASNVPLWMVDLIRYFDLRRKSFSKYVTSVRNVINRYKYDPSLRHAATIL